MRWLGLILLALASSPVSPMAMLDEPRVAEDADAQRQFMSVLADSQQKSIWANLMRPICIQCGGRDRNMRPDDKRANGDDHCHWRRRRQGSCVEKWGASLPATLPASPVNPTTQLTHAPPALQCSTTCLPSGQSSTTAFTITAPATGYNTACITITGGPRASGLQSTSPATPTW